MRAGLAERGTEALFVTQGNRVLCEWYAPEWHAGRTHYSVSLAKALVGDVSFIVAMGDGRIKPDDLAAHYVPKWRNNPARSHITIRHLATHTSGLSDASHTAEPDDPERGWETAFWKRDPDPFTISRDRTPMLFEPGSTRQYSNPGMAMLGYCAGGAGAGHQVLVAVPSLDLIAVRLGKPLEDVSWNAGFWAAAHRHVIAPLMAALEDTNP